MEGNLNSAGPVSLGRMRLKSDAETWKDNAEMKGLSEDRSDWRKFIERGKFGT